MSTAVGVLEFDSFVQGIGALDKMLKSAPISLVKAVTVCPGRYMTIISGKVSAVQAAVEAAKAAADYEVESFVSGRIHESVLKALTASNLPEEPEALGLIETLSVPAAIGAADIAVKASDVELAEIRISRGMGGRAFTLITGDTSSVGAALDAVKLALAGPEIIDTLSIPKPDASIFRHIA